jgi:16S rRNA (adenine1518-N6/adenine1519-N6)-dimethyltransferase
MEGSKMSLSSPSHLRAFLDEMGVHPKKSLSQNFLIDKNILLKIIKTADVQKGDLVLEIGAGPGALTETLLEAGADVIAIEKDDTYAEKLKRFPLYEIFAGDVRDYPFDKLPKDRKVKVVANLPYHLTSVILSLLLPRKAFFSTLTLMVQDEVGRRMTAKSGGKDYSSLSVFLDYYAYTKYAFTVSNRCFYPIPKVQSAIVTLEMRQEERDADPLTFFPLVRAAFQKRRKMMRSSLSHFFPPKEIEEALEKIGSRKEARPEILSIDEWVAFYHLLIPLLKK